jgi:hypothetical protein
MEMPRKVQGRLTVRRWKSWLSMPSKMTRILWRSSAGAVWNWVGV